MIILKKKLEKINTFLSIILDIKSPDVAQLIESDLLKIFLNKETGLYNLRLKLYFDDIVSNDEDQYESVLSNVSALVDILYDTDNKSIISVDIVDTDFTSIDDERRINYLNLLLNRDLDNLYVDIHWDNSINI